MSITHQTLPGWTPLFWIYTSVIPSEKKMLISKIAVLFLLISRAAFRRFRHLLAFDRGDDHPPVEPEHDQAQTGAQAAKIPGCPFTI